MFYTFTGLGERTRLASLGDVDARERDAVAAAKARRHGHVQGEREGIAFASVGTGSGFESNPSDPQPAPEGGTGSESLPGAVAVYVPSDRDLGAMSTVVPGSAIVGEPVSGTDLIRVYYEGDVYATGMTFATKLLHAAGRMVEHYPTIATRTVRSWMLTQVGTYDPVSKTFDITDPAALENWATPGEVVKRTARCLDMGEHDHDRGCFERTVTVGSLTARLS